MASSSPPHTVALIGLGAIGISWTALHLRYSSSGVSVFDPRQDLQQHIESILPGYLGPDHNLSALLSEGRLRVCNSLQEVCENATIVQEQGPENLDFKRATWTQIERYAPPQAHLWSSTSGIAASLQNQDMVDPSRLIVVHPFNPPHIMPLIEIVPPPGAQHSEITFARDFFENLESGHRPIVLNKELPGFVGNRLAYALFREAAYLVDEDVLSAADLDRLVEASLGPRWAVQGPFKSYNMGGGIRGIEAFLDNLSGTMQNIWDSGRTLSFEKTEQSVADTGWATKVIQQTKEAYGMPSTSDFDARDDALRQVLHVQQDMYANARPR